MDEYVFRSRGRRVPCYVMGTLLVTLNLVLAPMAVSGFLRIEHSFSTSLANAEAVSGIGERTKQDEDATKDLLDEAAETERKIASGMAVIRVMMYAYLVCMAFGTAVGVWFIVMPLAALRRARRRAHAWETSRCGHPWHKSSLAFSIIYAVFLNAVAPALLAVLLLAKDLASDVRIPLLVLFSISQPAGILLLGSCVLHATRRFHFRDWRLRLDQVPLQPGEAVHFEIFRESGKPLDKGLQFEFIRWEPKWNVKSDCMKSGRRLRVVPDNVETETPAADGPPLVVTGTLQIHNNDLTSAPPEGEKHPRRLFAFLRARRGWWRRCLFDLPVPEIYVTPEPLRQE